MEIFTKAQNYITFNSAPTEELSLGKEQQK